MTATPLGRGERKKGVTGRLRDIKNEAQNVYREVKGAADEAQGAYRETLDQVEAARKESRPADSRTHGGFEENRST